MNIHGRQYPVDVYYTLEPEADYLDAAFLTCLQVINFIKIFFTYLFFKIHEDEDEGGILVFLPGQEDIDSLKVQLIETLPFIESKMSKASSSSVTGRRSDFVVHSLYAAMTPEQQLRAFELPPNGSRKFVLSTNIAETSVTIPGIRYVVDPGLVKVRSQQDGTGFDMLKVMPVSQSQSNQRAGRAGRECAGKCFRLFQEREFEALSLCTIPEIQRISISQAMLQLISMGIDVIRFPFPSPPVASSQKLALMQLVFLGALHKDGVKSTTVP